MDKHPDVKRCNIESCRKPLYRSNKSGFCWRCFEKSPQRLEHQKRAYCMRKYGRPPEALVRKCVGGCGFVLRYVNKTGACRRCYKTLASTRNRNNEVNRAHWKKVKEENPEVWQRRLEQYRASMHRSRSTPESKVRFLLRDANSRAGKCGVPFGATLADLGVLPTVCPVFGVALDYSCGKGKKVNDNAATLDRVVPSLGYVAGNVCIISWRANRIKHNATPEELQALADYATRMARKLSIVS